MKETLLELVLATFFAVSLTFAQTPTANQPAPPAPDASASALANAPFRNPLLPIAERVDDLISRMTLQEKVEQIMHAAPAIPRLGIPAYNWWSEGFTAWPTQAMRRSFHKQSAWRAASILTCFTPRQE